MNFALYFCLFSVLFNAGYTYGGPVPVTIPISMHGPLADALKKAEDLAKTNKPEEAIALLSGFQPVGADEITAYYAVYARALVRSERLFEAFERFRLAYIFCASDIERSRLLLERAETYEKAGYYPEAAVCYERFLKIFSQSDLVEHAHIGAADCRAKLEQFSEALRHYEQAGTSSRAQYGRANMLQALGMFKDSFDLYVSLIAKDKGFLNGSEETRYAVGENFRIMGRLADAKIYLNSVRSLALRPRAELSLSRIALQEKLYDAALQYAGNVLQSSDRAARRQGLLLTAEAHMHASTPEAALPFLQEIMEKYPYSKENDMAAVLLARVARNSGHFDEAVSLLKPLILRRSPETSALDELEYILLAVKDTNRDQFLKLWTTAGPWLMEPARVESLITVARVLRGTGQPFLDVNRWLIKHGTLQARAQAGLLLADFYAGIGDPQKATEYLNKAGINSGSGDETLRIAAKVYAARGEFKKASQILLSIRNSTEQDVLLLLDIVPATKNAKPVIEFSESVFKKIPGTVRMYVRFADLLYSEAKKAEAIRYYEAATKARPSGADDSTAKDMEWARYRLSLLSRELGISRTVDNDIPKGRRPSDRLAEADSKGKEITQKLKKLL